MRKSKERDVLKHENRALEKSVIDESICTSCVNLNAKVAELESTINKFNKPHKDLSIMLE